MAYIFSEMQLAGSQNTEWTWYYIVVKKIGVLFFFLIGVFLMETSNNVLTALFWGWGKWRCGVKYNMGSVESGMRNQLKCTLLIGA